MRVMRDYQDGAVTQSYLDAAQHSSSLAARAGEAWSNWEIQFLVMASFSLQVFLLLGRLTLLMAVATGKRQQLALFWAPFLLLHLGGQEMITAFSMEDNMLWKRRVLDLAVQVAMAVYLVAKQWRRDRMLVAPMVLMFVSGAVKYGERIWVLSVAAVMEHRRSFEPWASIDSIPRSQQNVEFIMAGHYARRLGSLHTLISSEGKTSIERILEEAYIEFPQSLDFFMDVTPLEAGSASGLMYYAFERVFMEFKSSKNGEWVLYKLVEMELSLIHDFLCTKFGTVRFQAPKKLNPTTGAVLQWLGSLGLTSVALVLFARASRRSNDHSGADVLISYILLVGAILMEVSSILIALVSTCWAGTGVAKRLHLHEGKMWSGELPQYNMVDAACDQERERRAVSGGGVGTAVLRWMLASWETSTHVAVSPEVKKLLLNKVLEVAVDIYIPRNRYWDFRRFQGQWATWTANRFDEDRDDSAAGPAHKSLSTSRIQEKDFVSTVVLWHLVTIRCLQAGDGGPGEVTSPSKELSNYVIYLVAKRSVMVDVDGRLVIGRSQQGLINYGGAAFHAHACITLGRKNLYTQLLAVSVWSCSRSQMQELDGS